MSSYNKAPKPRVHPFLKISTRNNQCFCHCSVCILYRPNNCSVLMEDKHFQDACKCLHIFDHNKQVHLHWQLFTVLFYIQFSSILSLCRTIKLLNSSVSTTLNMPRVGVGHLCLTPWPLQPAAKSHVRDPFSTSPAAQRREAFPASRGEGRQATKAKTDQSSSARFRRDVPLDTGMPVTHNVQPGFMPCSSLASMLPTRASACSSALVAKEKSNWETLALLTAEAERCHLHPLWRGMGKGLS